MVCWPDARTVPMARRLNPFWRKISATAERSPWVFGRQCQFFASTSSSQDPSPSAIHTLRSQAWTICSIALAVHAFMCAIAPDVAAMISRASSASAMSTSSPVSALTRLIRAPPRA